MERERRGANLDQKRENGYEGEEGRRKVMEEEDMEQ